MFTMRHLNRVMPELKGLNKPNIFYVSKSEIAYRLSKMNSQFRGHAIEKMVRDELLKKHMGNYHGGSHSHDITINKKTRVEVKSSLASPRVKANSKKIISYSFTFKHIQLEKFDILVLSYVTPTGVVTKWMSKATAMEFVSNKYEDICSIHITTTDLNKLPGTDFKKLDRSKKRQVCKV